ncbi:DUF7837 family putative zinc-binding protein [Halorubrum salinarum]
MFNPSETELPPGRRVTRSSFPPMTDTPPALGHCPSCDTEISAAWKLIEYEQADGSTGVFAECPSCDEVVNPE